MSVYRQKYYVQTDASISTPQAPYCDHPCYYFRYLLELSYNYKATHSNQLNPKLHVQVMRLPPVACGDLTPPQCQIDSTEVFSFSGLG